MFRLEKVTDYTERFKFGYVINSDEVINIKCFYCADTKITYPTYFYYCNNSKKIICKECEGKIICPEGKYNEHIHYRIIEVESKKGEQNAKQ